MSTTEMSKKEENLAELHRAAEAEWTTFSYAKPDGVSSGKGFVALGRKDIVRGVVQVVKKHGGENNLHYHTGIASFWMVLKGRVRFYGPDDVVIGEFGPHGGHHHAALLALLVREHRRGRPRNPPGRGVRFREARKERPHRRVGASFRPQHRAAFRGQDRARQGVSRCYGASDCSSASS